MMQLGVGLFLIGILMSLNFRVFILIPATLLAWLVAGFGASLFDTGGLGPLSRGLLAATALQLGYLLGLLLPRPLRLASRLTRKREAVPAPAIDPKP
jgi:hypothetical protein